jgi:hypothetical protein
LSFPILILGDLEQYIIEHISSYSKNICDFPGVKGNDEMKKEINKLYRDHRKTSMKSTIVFKANKTRTTPAQQILLKNKKLFLYVDGAINDKKSNKKKKVLAGK